MYKLFTNLIIPQRLFLPDNATLLRIRHLAHFFHAVVACGYRAGMCHMDGDAEEAVERNKYI